MCELPASQSRDGDPYARGRHLHGYGYMLRGSKVQVWHLAAATL
jgi:hypothetical protein